MGANRKLKRGATSTTDVEAGGDYETQKQQKKQKISDDSKKVEADGDYETQKQQKKQKKYDDLKKEMKKLRKSFKEMTKTMKGLQEKLLTKADRSEISVKKESPKKKPESLYECNFISKDVKGNNEKTLIVRGFDTLLPRADIRRALSEHFSSCGEVKRVYVPIECLTGVSKGYAFVDMKEDHRKALKLSGSLLGGFKIMVMMAKHTDEFYVYPNFRGCHRCSVNPCIAMKERFDERNRLLDLISSRSQLFSEVLP